MGWWSKTVMGGDEPWDWESDFAHVMGVGFDKDTRRYAYTRPLVEEHLHALLTRIEQFSRPWNVHIAHQVLGVVIMNVGADAPPELREGIAMAAERDEWAEEDEERRGYMTELAAKIRAHKAGEIVTLKREYLMDKIHDGLLAEQQKRESGA
jgi:hypothetical protein